MKKQTHFLKALVRLASSLPDTALPHLGTLAHIGIAFPTSCRRPFFKAIPYIFSPKPSKDWLKQGMQSLLNIPGLDYSVAANAVREAIRLRRMLSPVEQVFLDLFFSELRKARSLRRYYRYELFASPFDPADEDILESFFDGTAFLKGGIVSKLEARNSQPTIGRPVIQPPQVASPISLAPAARTDSPPTIAPLELPNTRSTRTSKWLVASGHWYHLPIEDPPQEYNQGTLEGTKKELSEWLQPGKDDRELKRRADGGSVWVRRLSGTHWEVWFRDKALYEFASANSLKPQPSSTE